MAFMACCKACCGCQDCEEGQEGKCCCGGSFGTCCDAGEFCCYGECRAGGCCTGNCDEFNPCPFGCYCCDGVCVDQPCGACCTYDEGTDTWTCSETTEADCTGKWQGAFTTCADGDCSDTCCEDYVVTPGSCTVSICEAGHFASVCAGGAGCDPSDPQPDVAPVVPCQSGTVLETTVTVSGVTFDTGDSDLDAFLDDVVNTSYSITRVNCDGTAANNANEIVFNLGDGWFVNVTFPTGINRFVGLNFYTPASTPSQQLYLERSEGSRTAITSACGGSLYDCDERVNGSPTDTAGVLEFDCDFTNANITTS